MTPEDEEFNRIEMESRIKQEYIREMKQPSREQLMAEVTVLTELVRVLSGRVAELEKAEPVAWVDPATLYQLKIGLEGVHLVYETEMVNSLPLYDKPQFQNPKQCLERLIRIMGTFDLATGHADTFDALLDSLESELRDVLGYYRQQRTWVDLTKEECFELCVKHKDNSFSLLVAVQEKLKDKNND
jgi:hypothetical protein